MNYLALVRLSLLSSTIFLVTACGQSATITSLPPTPSVSILPSQTALIMPSSLVVPTVTSTIPTQMVTNLPTPSSAATAINSIVVNNSNQSPVSTSVSNSMIGAKQYSQTVLPFTFRYPQDWIFHHENDGSITFLSPKSAEVCHNADPYTDMVHYECVPDMSLRSYPSEKDYLSHWGPSTDIEILSDVLQASPHIRIMSTRKIGDNTIVSFFSHNSEADTLQSVIQTSQMVYQLSFDRDGISHNLPHVLSEQQASILDSIRFISNITSNSNMQQYLVSSAPFSFQYPQGWEVEDNGMRTDSICLASSTTLAERKKPFLSQPTEGGQMVKQSDICIGYISDIVSQIGPRFGQANIKSLAELLDAEKEDVEILGITKVDGKTAIKVLESGMPSHQIWYIESGKGLYTIEFRQIISDEPLTTDELGIVNSLKLLK